MSAQHISTPSKKIAAPPTSTAVAQKPAAMPEEPDDEDDDELPAPRRLNESPRRVVTPTNQPGRFLAESAKSEEIIARLIEIFDGEEVD